MALNGRRTSLNSQWRTPSAWMYGSLVALRTRSTERDGLQRYRARVRLYDHPQDAPRYEYMQVFHGPNTINIRTPAGDVSRAPTSMLAVLNELGSQGWKLETSEIKAGLTCHTFSREASGRPHD